MHTSSPLISFLLLMLYFSKNEGNLDKATQIFESNLSNTNRCGRYIRRPNFLLWKQLNSQVYFTVIRTERTVLVKESNIILILLKKADKICLYQFLYDLNISSSEHVCSIKIIVFSLFFINFKRHIIIYQNRIII